MPKIVINEIDLTTPGSAAESTDVVYIPGFVVTSSVTAESGPIEKNKPELFTSVADFISRCGKTAPAFSVDQDFEDISIESGSDTFIFDAAATSGMTDPKLFKKDENDPGYTMAKELLAAGLSVLYERVNDTDAEISAVTMYTHLATVAYDNSKVDGIVDRGNYSIKYLTSGGYPVFEFGGGTIVTKMLSLAKERGDCVALIDHVDNPSRTINAADSASVYAAIQSTVYDDGDFGTMFTPWATYNRTTSDVVTSNGKETRVSPSFRAPGSFAYLTSLADSIKTNANWLAIAGAARGGVRNLADRGMDVIIPNGVADAMQSRESGKIAVNPITNINPYGPTIWGNRTLKKNEDNLVATNFLNIRNLVSDIKKTCYKAARKATFEQDTDILWTNFKSDIAKLLERMKSGYGISGYKIVRDNDHEQASANATLCAKIIIYPTYAVEDFYITVVLQDDEVSVD